MPAISQRSKSRASSRSRRNAARNRAEPYKKRAGAFAPALVADAAAGEPERPALLLLLPGSRRNPFLTLRDFGVVVGVAHVGDIHPRVGHLVDRAIAPADPLVRIRIARLRGGVVVP